MNVSSIKTNIFNKDDDLCEFIIINLKKGFKEKSVLVVTSKLLSLSLGLTISKNNTDKIDLIKSECDHYLGEGLLGHHITIKNNLIMPTAGIDNSNSQNNEYILLPKQISQKTKLLHGKLSAHFGFENWGIIFCDSKTSFLRRGVTGTSLSYYGFQGLVDLKGKKDIFGNDLRITTQNRVDPLAAAAVFEMGESDEIRPLVVITDIDLNFSSSDNSNGDIYLNIKNDLYSPLYVDKIQN